ncbi:MULTISPECIES: hypothetical protein [Heyndrickxia]|jgi:tetrahydromethanopterin S-methyltransferase subunit G|uniref:hypothetical protein n=1 Tax=Heyndrickxia TaxID=2837504 RepID=UPI0003A26FFA|nr:hypothetical protein [Heyndrickxia oleronia]NYV64266.1 hypothetical protein [Bacillus sp. Gen3]MBU5212628.1 hypothetical protein [Heyndrickxia oleronia]MCI1592152.1 hypothetical protein [Heyndrickxia oleronia]MCI1612738.1 hypothetical protein [Heyndrickxia oleronia]MCI1744004.1 hypothetical protein [Heyndrickxia oleronia]
MDYRQQQAPTQFPWPPGQQNQNVNRRLDNIERRLDRLDRRFDRLERRVTRLERQMGWGQGQGSTGREYYYY